MPFLPSLLYTVRSAEHPPLAQETALSDLLPAAALSADIRTVLTRGAAPDEIPGRQEIFRLLSESGGFLTALEEIGARAAAVGTLVRRYTAMQGNAGAPMLFCHIVREVIALTETASVLEARGDLLSTFRGLFCSAAAQPWFSELREAHARAGSWNGCGVRLQTAECGLRIRQRGGESWKSVLDEAAAEMGAAPIPEKRRGVRQMPDSFPAALARLRPEQYDAACALQDRFAPMLFSDSFDVRSLPPLAEEVSFYTAMHRWIEQLRAAGFPMSYPSLSRRREIRLSGLRDISLFDCGLRGSDVVPNDAYMYLDADTRENFFFLCGANGGGKTTYLRALGSASLLFLNGCPVPCEGGTMGFFTRLFTHFPLREEYAGAGRFEEEERRAHDITEAADSESLVFLNETFSGTDEVKSEQYSRRLAETLHARGCFGVYVTHLHTLTGGAVPTLAAEIDESDQNRRTYRIVRQRATDFSHAADILRKHALTEPQLAERRRLLVDR